MHERRIALNLRDRDSDDGNPRCEVLSEFQRVAVESLLIHTVRENPNLGSPEIGW